MSLARKVERQHVPLTPAHPGMQQVGRISVSVIRHSAVRRRITVFDLIVLSQKVAGH